MPATSDSPSPQRALVVVDRKPPGDSHLPVTRTAPFLAHLIATARQLPQARARRRAEPADAIAAYREAIKKLSA